MNVNKQALVLVFFFVVVAAFCSFSTCDAVLPEAVTVGSFVVVGDIPATATLPGLLAFAIWSLLSLSPSFCSDRHGGARQDVDARAHTQH